MSRKKNKQKQEFNDKHQNEQDDYDWSNFDPKDIYEKEEKPVVSLNDDQFMNVLDVARLICAGYHAYWDENIIAFVKMKNFIEPNTVSKCKELLTIWGAKFK